MKPRPESTGPGPSPGTGGRPPHPGVVPTLRTVAVLVIALAALVLALGPLLPRPSAEWPLHSDASLDLVYDPARIRDPAAVAADLEANVRVVSAYLDLPWPPTPDDGGLGRPVFFAGPPRLAPRERDGRPVVAVHPDSPTARREAAAVAVLTRAAGTSRASPAIAAGLARLVDRTPPSPDAVAAALAERGRLASLPQLLRWWPSLPLGREQLASFASYVRDRWGPEGVVSLAQQSPDAFRQMSSLDRLCQAGLGVSLAQLDRDWTAWVLARAEGLDPAELEEARRALAGELDRVRLTVILLTAAVMAAAAAAALAFLPRRHRPGAAAALAAFAAAAGLELVLFTSGDLPLWAKSIVAASEVGLIAGVLAVASRGRRPELPAPGRLADKPASWLHLALAVALTLLVVAPRFGLYFYCREIWAKAPMIVLVLALVWWVEREPGGLRSLGLGPIAPGRLLILAAAGLAAFRLTTGLTELVFHGLFARVTGPAFAWFFYEPWWRAVGFNHYPLAPWPAWFPVVDVWDFFFGNFAEELFFRGYLLFRLQRTLGWWKALFAQAFLFGLFHVNYDLFPFHPLPMTMYVLMATAFGVLMGLLLRHTGTLLVPALVHPFANLGVLWVGVSYAGSPFTWTTIPVYYLLQTVLGLAVIPPVLALVNRGPRPPRPAAPRRRRQAREEWVEARYG